MDAERFARAWLAAWNARDLEAILAHYADGVVFSSPVVARLACDPSGVLRGKPALRAYFARALAAAPELGFELEDVQTEDATLRLTYRSRTGGRVVETMRLDGAGHVVEASVAYARRGEG